MVFKKRGRPKRKWIDNILEWTGITAQLRYTCPKKERAAVDKHFPTVGFDGPYGL